MNNNVDPFHTRDNQDLKTQIELLESRLASTNRRLENCQREFDSMLYYLSHDLRAPLRGIDGYSQALFDEYGKQLDGMGKAYLEYIRDSSNHISRLIDGLLRLSRIERTSLEEVPVNLSDLAQSIVRDFQEKNPFRKIEFKCAQDLAITTDPGLVQLLMKCLLDNAFKFTSKHPEARIEFGEIEKDGQNAFFLRDDGAGFSMEYANQLFVPFQRLHGQHEFEGLGLGLAMAQRIVRRLNGQIWMEGKPEEGATVYFNIKYS